MSVDKLTYWRLIMNNEVVVGIPVTPEVAGMLRDQDIARSVGRLVSAILRPSSPERDPLATMIAEIKSAARAGGLTDDEIDAELDAHNAEHRF
jgi:hypothetical protein